MQPLIEEFRNSGIRGLRDSGIEGFRDLGRNSGIHEFRDLGIEGILSILIYRFYFLIPQFLNPPIPQSSIKFRDLWLGHCNPCQSMQHLVISLYELCR